jgi:diadenosine tetraphosphate (Ap4A) HIT family hydrolase
MENCLSCDIIEGKRTPIGDVILETEFFHAHQDIAYPIPGLVIIASKRHFYCIDDLNKDEAEDFVNIVMKIRKCQRHALNIEYVYYFYNEDTKHHFHLWMVPRYEWMKKFGRSVESLRPVLLYAKEKFSNEEGTKNIINAIKMIKESLKII